jgi:hypothetical protein
MQALRVITFDCSFENELIYKKDVQRMSKKMAVAERWKRWKRRVEDATDGGSRMKVKQFERNVSRGRDTDYECS